MLLRDHVVVKPLDLFDTRDICFWFLNAGKFSSFRSGVSSLTPISLTDNTIIEHSEINAMISLFNRMNATSSSLSRTSPLSVSQQEEELFEHIVDFAATRVSNPLYFDRSQTISLYLAFHIYINVSAEFNGWSDRTIVELLDFFRLCVYLPTMFLQQPKHKCLVGYDQVTKAPVFVPIKVALPTLKYLREHSLLFRTELELFTTQQALNDAMVGYFIFPLMVVSSSLWATDQDLIPSVWQHSSLIEKRQIPSVGVSWQQSIQDLQTIRVYPIPDAGITVLCKNYGDVQSLFFKERVYREIDGIQDLFCKITFKDGFEDLVIVSLSHGTIQISAFMDIYETQADPVIDMVMKIYTDFACRKAHDRAFDPKRKKMTFTYRDSMTSGEAVVYLPRSVSAHYQDQSLRDSESSLARKRPHWVDTHIRRLPIGWKASEKAAVLASQFGFVLPPGYTFVAPYHTGDSALADKIKLTRSGGLKNKLYISRRS